LKRRERRPPAAATGFLLFRTNRRVKPGEFSILSGYHFGGAEFALRRVVVLIFFLLVLKKV